MTFQKTDRRMWVQIVVAIMLFITEAKTTKTHAFILRPTGMTNTLSSMTRNVPSTKKSSTLRHSRAPVLRPLFSTSLCSKKTNSSSETRKKKKRYAVVEYNDDAFGLVFLCGAFVAQDGVFSTTFVLFSAAAAIACRQGKIQFTNQVPAAVAGTSLLVGSVLSQAMQATSASLPDGLVFLKSESALQVELAVCSISILYGFVLSPLLNNNKTEQDR
jgi:hypothetical protein